MNGWNLEKSSLLLPPKEASPGIHLVAATNGKYVSNYVPFARDTLPEAFEKESNDEPKTAQKVKLPVIVNGRVDRPGDRDVFQIEGHAGETIVVEVHARRLGSPLDSFVKVTTADRKVIALNDDHHDAGSGWNTHHADSYLMVKLPADGRYYVHIGDTTRHGGTDYAYRLRISQPQPDFALRVVPSRAIMRSKKAVALTVFALRKDGYTGPIRVNFKDLPEGFQSSGTTIGANKTTARLTIKTSLVETEEPIKLTVVGTAKIGDREIVHEAVPAEDRMQAFLWRHLLPADELLGLVYNPSYKPLAERVRPPIRPDQRPKNARRNLRKSQVEWYVRQIERLYQEWLLTDEFANRQIANIEARLIK